MSNKIINIAGEILEGDERSQVFVTHGVYDSKIFLKKDRKAYLEYCLGFRPLENKGLILEFGVYKGRTLKVIAKTVNRKVYGFDSFEGLSEDWGTRWIKGTFALPNVPDLTKYNIKLISGYFQDTLENFLKNHTETVDFLHMDADLYESTAYVLQTLKDRIVCGTVIAFDEIQNHESQKSEQEPTWQEAQAFREFMSTSKLKHTWIAHTNYVQACALLHE